MSVETQQQVAQMSVKTKIKWAITFLVPIMLWLLPEGDVYTTQVKLYCIITAFGILLIAFEFMDPLIPALIIPLGYLLLGVAPKEVVFESWSGSMPWMFLGMFLFAGTLQRIGLIKRVAYWCVVKIGGGFKGLSLAVLVAGIGLSIVLPGGNAHLPLLFFVYGICKASGWENTKESALLMMFATLGTYTATKFILNPYILMMLDMTKYEGSISFFDYFIHNAVYLLWVVLVALMMYFVLKPKGEMPPKEFYKEKYEELGPLSKDEKKGVLVALLAVVLIMTINIHHIDMGWCFVLVACLLFMPGINIGTKEDIKGINYSMPFFVGACMTLGTVATHLGLGKTIAEMILPYVSGLSNTGFYMVAMIVCVICKFVMSPLGIVATLTVPLVDVARTMGVNELATMYVIYFGANQVVLPYEYIAYLVMFSFGMMKMTDFIKVYGAKLIMSLIFLPLVVIPYWYLIGLL